jgi:hypothetical protein
MKNVTISMDEGTLAWVREQAAKSGLSVSAWLSQAAAKARGKDSDFETDMAAFLATPRTSMSDGGRTFNREEIYDRRVFRRFR